MTTDGSGPAAPDERGVWPGDEFALWESGLGDESHSLADLVNRLLDRGVVIVGDITISVAGVDLVDVSLNAVLGATSTVRSRTVPPPQGEP